MFYIVGRWEMGLTVDPPPPVRENCPHFLLLRGFETFPYKVNCLIIVDSKLFYHFCPVC